MDCSIDQPSSPVRTGPGLTASEILVLDIIRFWTGALYARNDKIFWEFASRLQHAFCRIGGKHVAGAFDGFMGLLMEEARRKVHFHAPACRAVSIDEMLLIAAISALQNGETQICRSLLHAFLTASRVNIAMVALDIVAKALAKAGFELPLPATGGRAKASEPKISLIPNSTALH